MQMKCPLCSEECQSFIDPASQISYWHCSSCGLIGKTSGYYQEFREQKKRYDLHQNSGENEGYRAYFRRFIDFVLPGVGSVECALDFGSGASSLLADMLGEKGIVCDRYDPIYYPDDSYRTQNYGLIVSVEVFEHLHYPAETFVHLLERLEPEGFLAIQTQFHDNDVKKFLSWYYRLDPTHIVFFTPETFRKLCDLNGCRYLGDNGKNIVLIQKGASTYL